MKKRVHSAADIGLDEVATNAIQTSNYIDVTPYERVAVFCNFIADAGGSTSDVTCQVEFTPDPDSTPLYTKDQAAFIAGTGTTTLKAQPLYHAVTPGSDDGWTWELGTVCAIGLKLTFTFTNGHADDALKVRVVGANYH